MAIRSRSSQIPLLRDAEVSKLYFDQPIDDQRGNSLRGQFHFHHRCDLKTSIPPHRADLYTVILVTDGEGVHTLGTRDYFIGKNMLCFVGPNVINAWNASDDNHRGFFCSFSDEFFSEVPGNKICLSDLPFFEIDGNAVIELGNERAADYITLFRMIEREHASINQHSPDILRGFLQVLIAKAKAHASEIAGDSPQRIASVRLLKNFTALYMSHINSIRNGELISLKKMSEYAAELGVSQNHLNDTIKSITGRSAGSLLRRQIANQATMCLTHSKESISEIAYRLGFEDPAYFTRFYKKQTGKLPSDLREG